MALGARELVRLWHVNVWNERRHDLMGEYLAPDGVVHSTDEHGGTLVGPEGFRPFYEKMLEVFPDIRFEIEEVVGDETISAARWRAHFTHRGDGLGVKATNREITITGMSMVRAENGKVVEAWNEWDRMKMACECGLMAPVAKS
jgi:steroid delta-isomerase-like uncharacterized protein